MPAAGTRCWPPRRVAAADQLTGDIQSGRSRNGKVEPGPGQEAVDDPAPVVHRCEARRKFPGPVVNHARRVDGGLETLGARDRGAEGTSRGARSKEVAVPAGPNAYNSLWQVRTDAWSALEESTAQLALAGTQRRPVEQLTDAVAEALDVLAPVERFWAFPGMRAFYRVRRLFATGKYERCGTP